MKKYMTLRHELRPIINAVIKEEFPNAKGSEYAELPDTTKRKLPFGLDSNAPVLTLDMARQIGKYINVDFSKIKVEDLYAGIKIETEHKDLDTTPNEPTTIRDWIMYAKIAHAHLQESPKYYEELDKMENKLKNENVQQVEKYINTLSPKRKQYANDYYHYKSGASKDEPNAREYDISKVDCVNIEKTIDKLFLKENKMDIEQKLRLYIRESIKQILSEIPQKNQKIYLKQGEKAPKGAKVSKGPKGGSYYYTVGKEGPKHFDNKKKADVKPSNSDKYFDDVHKRGKELEKNKKTKRPSWHEDFKKENGRYPNQFEKYMKKANDNIKNA